MLNFSLFGAGGSSGQLYYILLVFHDLFHFKNQGLCPELLYQDGDTQVFGFYSEHVSRLVCEERDPHDGHAILDRLHHTVHPSMSDK